MMLRSSLKFIALAAVVSFIASPFAGGAVASSESSPGEIAGPANAGFTLTPAEKAAGWTMLFDGVSTDAWRGYRKAEFPTQGWTIENGTLKVNAGGGGGDIITKEQYGDFELVLEWKVAPGANSGIMYRVSEQHDYPWQTGPEYQILDDAGYNVEPTHVHASGSLYDLYPPAEGKKMMPVGEFNTTRIRLKDNRLEHWLNGVKVVEVNIASEAWAERIAQSKFAGYEGFGVLPKGHLALQDHGNDVWFRNIRVRHLDQPLPNENNLLAGNSLSKLTAHLNDGASMSSVFRMEGDVLNCSGTPAGYIRTKDQFTNFVLKLEWRWDPETKATGNSGVLVRTVGEDKVWPKCIEAQLHADSAGDLLALGGATMQGEPSRTRGIRTSKTHHAENAPGEWNEYEIIVNGGEIVVFVNGEKLNHATGLEEVAGTICLQSEGTPIQFRRIRVAPIESTTTTPMGPMPPKIER